MTYNVVILKSARYEYESIVGYLAQILMNPRAAGNFVAEFEHQLDLLREQPLSHIRELAARNYQSFPVNNYACLYKFERDTIYIAHVFHQSHDYARLV
jgi:plasmid stabilization system protein ParE